MMRYILTLIAYLVSYILAMLLNPVFVLFAKPTLGPVNNNNGIGVEPRLPNWLSWFMTTDNSLWGDNGWQTKHCPEFRSYLGQVKWLWRNAAQGFSWSVLAYQMDGSETFTLKHSGSGVIVDKGRDQLGWFYIRSSNGAWQFRYVGYLFSFEAGWLIDPFYKRGGQCKALFLFGP